MQIITNNSWSLLFFEMASGQLFSRSDLLRLDDWSYRLQKVDLQAHLRNGSPPLSRPDRYEPVIGLFPIPPRTSWLYQNGVFQFQSTLEKEYTNFSAPPEIGDLEKIATYYLNQFNNRPFAIELSGGLDTAIIIDLVRAVGGKPVLIGFTSDRYEFRTERVIQDLLISEGDIVHLIPQSDCLHFSDLESTPVHVLPTAASLFHRSHTLISDAACLYGVTHVLNGFGGDALLCDELPVDNFPNDYHGWAIDNPWFHENIYAPRGMSYVPTFSLWPIPYIFWMMRKGKKQDNQKLWARSLFEDRLPSQLTRWAYKADHNGHFHSGLKAAEKSIQVVTKTAYEFTGHPSLEPSAISSLIHNSTHLGDDGEQELLSLLSFANWVHSLIREGLV